MLEEEEEEEEEESDCYYQGFSDRLCIMQWQEQRRRRQRCDRWQTSRLALRLIQSVVGRCFLEVTCRQSLVRVMEEENEAMFRLVEQKLRSPLEDEDTEFITCLIGYLLSSSSSLLPDTISSNLTSSIEGFQAIQKRSRPLLLLLSSSESPRLPRPALVDLLHELMRAPTPPPMESADSLEVEKQENLRGLGMVTSWCRATCRRSPPATS